MKTLLSVIFLFSSLSMPADVGSTEAGNFFSPVSKSPATIYQVGPSRIYQTVQQVAGLLNPGDVVEVDGNHTYPGGVVFSRSGTDLNKIHIKGIRINGNRPVISGATNGVSFTTPWPYTGPEGGHHYIFEGFEVTAAQFRGIYHQAEDLTIRDCFVHDCLGNGIMGADQGSGSILLEYTELARCGSGSSQHQIYMATDEVNNPGSVFRMQHCYIHSGNGGNNVKTRAERNEIYYNWIEGAYYHELELIGADWDACGGNQLLKREDSDVVGNVLMKKLTSANNNPNFFVTRIGGDGTGESNGRYRFLNNTFISGSSAVFRMFDALESVEIQNSVFYRASGNVLFKRTVEANWVSGQEVISGQNNWVKTGTLELPAQLTGTIIGSDPGFIDFAQEDFFPALNSPLVEAGILPTISLPGFQFPDPLSAPLKLPPNGSIEALDSALIRFSPGNVDIGAFSAVPFNLSVEGFVNQGETRCFDAGNTITVHGFSLEMGGSAKLIAGQKILINPETQINSGGYFHAWITLTSDYCRQQTTMITVGNPAGEGELTSLQELLNTYAKKPQDLRIFPNPTDGIVNIELPKTKVQSTPSIQIFNGRGEMVRMITPKTSQTLSVDLSEMQPGIYLIRMMEGNDFLMAKIIRQ